MCQQETRLSCDLWLCLPESSILGCSPTRNNLGDEDWGVISNVRVVGPSRDAESKTWVSLHTTETQAAVEQVTGWTGLLHKENWFILEAFPPFLLSLTDDGNFNFVLSFCKCKVESCDSKKTYLIYSGFTTSLVLFLKPGLERVFYNILTLFSGGRFILLPTYLFLKCDSIQWLRRGGGSHVRACDRVSVHSVFKADPIKQTEPGHGRIAWKRVGEGQRGMERDEAWGHEERSTMAGGERRERERER